MKSRIDLNNRGIVLLQSNCVAGACQLLERAATKEDDASRPRRTTTEALPHRSANSSACSVIDFYTLENSTDVKALLRLMHHQGALLVLIRLPAECPFAAAVIPYNTAMAQLAMASTCVLNTIKADQCRSQAKQYLEQAQHKVQKWCTVLAHKSKMKQSASENGILKSIGLLRVAVLLQLWVSVTLCRLDPNQERHDEIQQIQLFLLNHDQRQRLQQTLRVEQPHASHENTKKDKQQSNSVKRISKLRNNC